MQVNIYIHTTANAPKKKITAFGFVLECETSKGPATLTHFGIHENVNKNQAELLAIEEAIKKLNKPCDLVIYTTPYIWTAFNMWLPTWKANGWKNQKGKDEQFAGREELIGLRTRGKSSRPFEVVDRLEASAVAKWQQKEADLQSKLQEAQQRINQLQAQKSGNERMILSKEQQEEIRKFRRAEADTRRELKNVRKELTSDIDSLGTRLKCLNIIFVPVLVALFGMFRAILRRRR